MGIQDRDYYREKYKQTSKSTGYDPLSAYQKKQAAGRSPSKPQRKGLSYLLFPVVAIAALWYGADTLLKNRSAIRATNRPPAPPRVLMAPEKPQTIEPIIGGAVIKTDRQGHFRGTVLINNVAMPFLIDTGATKSVVPAKFAAAAGLPVGAFIPASTAGGQILERQTEIKQLVIGNSLIQNLDAHINDNLDEVLIGMNTLKYYRMTQTGNTLTLTANNQSGTHLPETPLPESPPSRLDSFVAAPTVKTPATIKKTVTCDEHNVCKTTYSDH